METPFGNYVKRTADIRKLSSPVLDSIENAEKYSNVLYHNFETIGELAVDNRSLLDEILYPLLNSQEPLEKDKIEEVVG